MFREVISKVIGMRRLNTCTRCILQTCSALLSICRAKIESRSVGVVATVATKQRQPLPQSTESTTSRNDYLRRKQEVFSGTLCLARMNWSELSGAATQSFHDLGSRFTLTKIQNYLPSIYEFRNTRLLYAYFNRRHMPNTPADEGQVRGKSHRWKG